MLKGREWNDGKILVPKNVQKNGRVHKYTYKSTVLQIDALSGTLKSRQTDRQIDRQIDRRTDTQTDKYTQRQTDR